ncbi:uncharacterized protein LOC141612600 [Silene latifolia]|uniref:uncharacterized protein LOC141612600 n=1 Tax=Silene latifolia TaxID=37657 RepID=UPI003D76C01E
MEDERMKWLRESKPVHVIESLRTCDCVRIMVDARWKAKENAGIRWVAFSAVGDMFFETSKAIKAESAMQAEALGIREVLFWALDQGLWHLEVSSGCLPIIAFIAGIRQTHHLTKEILDDILSLSSYFHCLSFSYIPRLFNDIAHGLACKAMIS